MNTVFGLLAVLFWSTTIAFSRSLTEQLGTVTAACCIYLIGGGIGVACLLFVKGKLVGMFRLPALYLFGCGGLFVVYMVSLYLAIGLAANRAQVIEVGIVNYLWPPLMLVLSVPLLKKKARLTLPLGVVAAFAGVVLATAHGGRETWQMFRENLSANVLPYVLAFVAAVSWALYSNLSRRWAGEARSGAVPLFLLATGVVLAVMRLGFDEQPRWTPRCVMELGYMAVLPTLAAYVFWDIAMRKGNLILVASFSYLTPLFSTFISSLYLRVGHVGLRLWLACALIIAGAVICKLSVIEPSGRANHEAGAEAGASPAP